VVILGQLLDALKTKATPAFRDGAAKRLEAMARSTASAARKPRNSRRTRAPGTQ